MKLSINLNKVALLRNARGDNYPDLNYFAHKAIDMGVNGLTLHPRPDHRHATSNDVIEIANICKKRKVEFNIEGNPFSEPNEIFKGFCELIDIIKPDQVTLVPDKINQITSDHGWESGDHDQNLIKKINIIKSNSTSSKISLFIDSIKGVKYAKKLNVDLIEIHTGEFAKSISNNDETILSKINEMIDYALNNNILINAGHDLNLNNLHYLVKIGNINEVSIGHAIIVDSLLYGYEETILKYLKIIRN
ncbi:MAG: pyridoxine 5'-phosphate synthase [Gammaproteobacteria bacterium]|nr:pyridoxine 5'-phosphate synthase [Gammaproteobacteria bacterium]|tara:strand:+ start:25 stop:768 length:744 start_codon:yes stop_codon:yes gene_type:complete